MIKKVAIIALCSSTIGLCMEKIEDGSNNLSLSRSNPPQQKTLSPDKKIEFMRNGASLSRSMPAHQKIEFMRNGQQVIRQLSDEENNHDKNDKPFVQCVQKEQPIIISPLKDDDKLTEEELVDYVSQLSLEEHQAVINEAIQKEKNPLEKNITVNYNVKIKQKLKNASQIINFGNKNNNKNKN
jgi:hypothetical protein